MSGSRYNSLDHWRGLACLLVMLHHGILYSPTYLSQASGNPQPFASLAALVLTIFSLGWIGVPMFFVISGYCISASAESTRRRHESTARYFFKRFRRIYPPYWFFLGFIIWLSIFVDTILSPGILSATLDTPTMVIKRPWNMSPWQVLGSFILIETWRPLIFGPGRSLITGHAWTLCYEEQFYAVTGLILLVARRWFFAAALVTTCIVLLVNRIALYWFGASLSGTFLDGYWLLFAVGILVFFVVNYGKRRDWMWSLLLLAAGIAYFMRNPSVMFTLKSNVFPLSMTCGLTFGILILVLHRFDSFICQFTLLYPLRWCGVRCYSLYLMHWPVMRLISYGCYRHGVSSDSDTLLFVLPLSIGATLLCGGVFHHWIERRFLNTPTSLDAPERIEMEHHPTHFHQSPERSNASGSTST